MRALFLILSLAASSYAAVPTWQVITPTTTAKATAVLAGQFLIYASSTASSGSESIILQGNGGRITARSGATVSTFSANGFSVISATATNFYGNGAGLTALTAANISAGSLGATVMASSVAAGAFYSADPIRTNLGLAIGTNVQAWDADLDKLATKDGSDLLKISSVAVNAVYPAAVTAGTYSNITLPAANVAAGTLSAGVLIPQAGVNLSTVTANHVLKSGDNMTGQLTTASTLTVQGNAFSVGGSSFSVVSGSVAVGMTIDGRSALTAYGPSPTSVLASGGNPNSIFRVQGSATNAIDFGTLSNGVAYDAFIQARDYQNYSTTYPLSLNPTGGNVGVGKTNPSATLTVKRGAVTEDTLPSGNWAGNIFNGTNNVSENGLLVAQVYGAAASTAFEVGNIYGASPWGFTSYLKVLGNGNVGIGTTAPSSKLEVAGDITTTSSITVQGNAFSVGGSTLVVIGGNVGIGTTAPATKLHVSSGVIYNDGTAAGITTTGDVTGVYIRGSGQYLTDLPASSGGAILASTQTFTGQNTFNNSVVFSSSVKVGGQYGVGLTNGLMVLVSSLTLGATTTFSIPLPTDKYTHFYITADIKNENVATKILGGWFDNYVNNTYYGNSAWNNSSVGASAYGCPPGSKYLYHAAPATGWLAAGYGKVTMEISVISDTFTMWQSRNSYLSTSTLLLHESTSGVFQSAAKPTSMQLFFSDSSGACATAPTPAANSISGTMYVFALPF